MVYSQSEPLAKLWNVTDNEVITLLELERNLTMVDGLLQPILEEYNTSFGGSYINVLMNCIFVYTVDPTKIDIIKSRMEPYFHFFNFTSATNSLVALRNAFDGVSVQAQRLKPFTIYCFIDIEFNNVGLFLYKYYNNSNREFLEAIQQYNVTFHYLDKRKLHSIQNDVDVYNIIARDIKTPVIDVQSDDNITARNIKLPILGGEGIYNLDDHLECSAGFGAKRKDKEDYFIIIAGHCTKTKFNTIFKLFSWNENTTGPTIGFMLRHQIEPIDIGAIFIGSDKYEPSMLIRNTDTVQNKELITYDVSVSSSYGTHLCKSGRTTHVTCGYVKGLNGFFTDNKKQFNGQLTFTNIFGEKGDSGGPGFSYKQDLRSVSLNSITVGGVNSAGVQLHILLPIEPMEQFFRNDNLEIILYDNTV
ncbi:serine protease [Gigaspora margarita]|uniref:Serine protease n=1 Tax=Gigaspora margarita TaxID=4874 RepID=A0A8H4A5C6_GIGMA|nr:serine protease [Gigaspora margarita]